MTDEVLKDGSDRLDLFALPILDIPGRGDGQVHPPSALESMHLFNNYIDLKKKKKNSFSYIKMVRAQIFL